MIYEQENIISYWGDEIGDTGRHPDWSSKTNTTMNDQIRVLDDLVQFQSNLHEDHAYQLKKGMHVDVRDEIVLQTSWIR